MTALRRFLRWLDAKLARMELDSSRSHTQSPCMDDPGCPLHNRNSTHADEELLGDT